MHVQAFLTKIFSLMFGRVGYGVTFLIRFTPGVMELAMVIGGVTNGPILAVFTLGMLVPWVGQAGALTGFLTGVTLSSWVAGGAQVYRSQLSHASTEAPPFPSSTAHCPTNWTLITNTTDPWPELGAEDPLPGYLPIYELSYIWYSSLGFWLTVLGALLVSLVWGQDSQDTDKRLLSPCLESIIQVDIIILLIVTNSCLFLEFAKFLAEKSLEILGESWK